MVQKEICDLQRTFDELDPLNFNFASYIQTFLDRTDYQLREQLKTHPEPVGCSLALVMFVGDQCYTMSIGSCQILLLRDDELYHMTRDHRLEEDPQSRPLLFLGNHPGTLHLKAQNMNRMELHPGDLLLICSDGLADALQDEQILHILSRPAPFEEQISDVFTTARRYRSSDNQTVLALKVESRRIFSGYASTVSARPGSECFPSNRVTGSFDQQKEEDWGEQTRPAPSLSRHNPVSATQQLQRRKKSEVETSSNPSIGQDKNQTIAVQKLSLGETQRVDLSETRIGFTERESSQASLSETQLPAPSNLPKQGNLPRNLSWKNSSWEERGAAYVRKAAANSSGTDGQSSYGQSDSKRPPRKPLERSHRSLPRREKEDRFWREGALKGNEPPSRQKPLNQGQRRPLGAGSDFFKGKSSKTPNTLLAALAAGILLLLLLLILFL